MRKTQCVISARVQVNIGEGNKGLGVWSCRLAITGGMKPQNGKIIGNQGQTGGRGSVASQRPLTFASYRLAVVFYSGVTRSEMEGDID